MRILLTVLGMATLGATMLFPASGNASWTGTRRLSPPAQLAPTYWAGMRCAPHGPTACPDLVRRHRGERTAGFGDAYVGACRIKDAHVDLSRSGKGKFSGVVIKSEGRSVTLCTNLIFLDKNNQTTFQTSRVCSGSFRVNPRVMLNASTIFAEFEIPRTAAAMSVKVMRFDRCAVDAIPR
jgi:hypothetical protein